MFESCWARQKIPKRLGHLWLGRFRLDRPEPPKVQPISGRHEKPSIRPSAKLEGRPPKAREDREWTGVRLALGGRGGTGSNMRIR